MKSSFTEDQRRWIDDYCNDSISAEDFEKLEEELLRSADFRELARSYFALDSHLQQNGETVIPITRAWGESVPLVRSGRKQTFFRAAAAAILFFLGIGAGGFIKSGPLSPESINNENDDGIATIQHSIDAVWKTKEEGELSTGSILSPGPLRLVSGLAQLEFYNGAQLVLQGPLELDLKSVNEVLFHRGKLRAFIPETAQGFTVLSSKFELVDLGTEFGVEIGSNGKSNVQVFDGEVELYPPDGNRSPDQKTRLLGGDGMAWDESGASALSETVNQNYPSFEDLQRENERVRKFHFQRWEKWNEETRRDPRLIVHYDFEGQDSRLLDSGPQGLHGRIVGSEKAVGRWPDKSALEFKRPGDRVRLEIPGEFDQMTLSAWIRVDALTGRTQAILLTDGFETARAHWQISDSGELRLGVRQPSSDGKVEASGYASPKIIGPKRVGVWTLVTTVYDRKGKRVSHHINGREVSRDKLVYDQALKLGSTEIGNWGLPLFPSNADHAIRNFVGRIDTLTVWNAALSPEEIYDTFLRTRP